MANETDTTLTDKSLERENINAWDWEHAERYCRRYLEKRLYDMGKTYADDARAFTTAIIVTYSRPFSGNFDRDGKRDPADTKYTDSLEPPAKALHDHIVNLRKTVFAHSDASAHNVRIQVESRQGSKGVGISTVATDPLTPLERTDVEGLMSNLEVFRAINEELRKDAAARLLLKARTPEER